MKNRYLALDFLRGLSIFGMVFSAIVPSGVLPAWMYHIQNPPPSHELNMQAAGIGWVDLVFPVFIFCMGAAIPLSGREKIRRGVTDGAFVRSVLERFGMLWLFSYAYVLLNYSDVNGLWPQVLTIAGFCALFPLYLVLRGSAARHAAWIRWAGAAAVCGIIAAGHFWFGEAVNVQRRGIIIFLLAFLYLFGSLIWYFTRSHPVCRAAVWGLILMFTLVTQYAGLPASTYADPRIRWWFNLEYIYFLLLLLPATWIGDGLWTRLNRAPVQPEPEAAAGRKKAEAAACLLLLLWTVWACCAFYLRLYGWNLGAGLAFWLVLRPLVRRGLPEYAPFFTAGVYLLFCGMLLDYGEGSIKKVPCTVAYCFASGGLGVFLLLAADSICRHFPASWPVAVFSGAGQNPLMAYVAFNSLVLPLMKATGFIALYRAAYPAGYPGLGVLRAAVITVFTMWVVAQFSRRRIFWKA